MPNNIESSISNSSFLQSQSQQSTSAKNKPTGVKFKCYTCDKYFISQSRLKIYTS